MVNFHHYTDFEKALASIIDTFSNLNGYNLDAILYMDQRATKTSYRHTLNYIELNTKLWKSEFSWVLY